MNGVTVNARCADTKYKLLIREKVTVIRGQSGTGKTRLIDIIRNTVPGNPTYQVDVSHRLFISAPSASDLLRNSVESWKDTLVFIDERIVDSLGDYFCSLVRESENYWVIISRNDDILRTIPFSMFEAYEFVKTNNVIVNKQIFSCDSRTFGGKFAVNTVTGFITEDSVSGWHFFNKALPKAVVKDSASSNTKVVSTVVKHLGSSACILVLFDACAFGPFLGDLLSLDSNTLRNIRNMGDKSYSELVEYLGCLGYSLDPMEESVDEKKQHLRENGEFLVDDIIESRRASLALNRAGIYSVDQLLSVEDVRCIPGVGNVFSSIILSSLREFSLGHNEEEVISTGNEILDKLVDERNRLRVRKAALLVEQVEIDSKLSEINNSINSIGVSYDKK